MSKLDLSGKVVLITGAARGIGRQTAIRMAEAGARVAINYSRSEDEARALAEEIGGFAVKADIGQPDQVQTMIDAVADRWQRLDILVNNAAIFSVNRFESDDYEACQPRCHAS